MWFVRDAVCDFSNNFEFLEIWNKCEGSAQNVTINFPVINVKIQGQNRRAEISSLVVSIFRYHD